MMETKTQTLTEFLLERIAEDEANYAVTDGEREYDWDTCPDLNESWVYFTRLRMLAECAAKRRRLEWLMSLEHDMGGEEFVTYDSCRILAQPGEMGDLDVGYCSCGLDARRDHLYRIDAMPHADHPDYRPEWVL